MVESAPFTIGAEARCTDGACGRLTRVVVDPLRAEVTHVIVEPNHRRGLGRLVPVDRIETAGPGQITLGCDKSEFETLEVAETNRFLPGTEGHPGYDPEQTLLWPYFGGNTTMPITFDTLPVGEVAVRRGQQVHATDGPIGEVKGLAVDTRNHHVTHVLLREGHFFGRKDVAIPMSAVQGVSEHGIDLSISKGDVADLPAMEG